MEDVEFLSNTDLSIYIQKQIEYCYFTIYRHLSTPGQICDKRQTGWQLHRKSKKGSN